MTIFLVITIVYVSDESQICDYKLKRNTDFAYCDCIVMLGYKVDDYISYIFSFDIYIDDYRSYIFSSDIYIISLILRHVVI